MKSPPKYRRRRIAVLALRLPRFMPHMIPRTETGADRPVRGDADGGAEDHTCNTELTSNCV
jgi:hypothetical protein